MMILLGHRFRAMGGPCELQVAATEPDQARHAFDMAEREVRRIERQYSRYLSDSVVSRINASAGAAWVDCDEETLHLLDLADTLHRQTDGLFDATSGVLRRAWRFDGSRREAPDDAELAPLLALVDWSAVERRGTQVRLARQGMELDFGGFGKEYAADRVASLWQQAGVSHALVNLAGDVRVLGGKPDGGPWLLGIQHPRRNGDLLGHLPLANGALATSGDYERFFTDMTGYRHCHILHPKTGRSAYHWQSISVVAPLALMAGGLCTGAMLMGPQALEWLRGQPVDFLAVDRHGAVHMSNAPGDS
jgi:thiamine biosynthesis lipoprotein